MRRAPRVSGEGGSGGQLGRGNLMFEVWPIGKGKKRQMSYGRKEIDVVEDGGK